MSFATEILKPASSKVTLFEIDIGVENDFWVSFCAGVYTVNFLDVYPKLVSFPTVPDAPSISNVGSVVVNGIQLAKVSSPNACRDQDSSFHYEAGTFTLYVHCPNGDDPDLFKIRIGQVYGFRYGGACADYGGVAFEDRLVDVPSLSQSKDPQFYGTIAFDSLSFKIINSDRKYDLLTREQNIFGNKGRILVGFDGWPITDFIQQFEGLITRITTDENFLTVEVKDQRAALTKAIPSRVFDPGDYSQSLDESDHWKPKPRIFGKCRNVPIYITDQAKTTGAVGATVTYNAKICDTAYSTAINAVNAIYVNGVDKTTQVGSLNLNTCSFTINHSTHATRNKYNPGDEVTADVYGEEDNTGTLIENGGTIIRKLLYDYYNISYTGDFYNFSHWFENRARDISLYLNEQKPLIDVIGQICSDGIQGDFFYDGDGKFCLKIWNQYDPSVQTIKRNQILSTPQITDDPTETITSTLIGYNKDHAGDEYYLLLDTTQETDIFDKYPVYRQERFDTILTDTTNAQDFSDNVFSKSSDVQTIIKIDIANWCAINRKIGDIITAYVDRPLHSLYNRCKCEVIGITINFANGTMSLDTRLIARLDDIPYTQSYVYTSNSNTPDNNYYCDNNDADRVYYGQTINEG